MANFSDPKSKKNLRILKASFSEKVFPYFSTLCGRKPLEVLPVASSVSLQKPREREWTRLPCSGA